MRMFDREKMDFVELSLPEKKGSMKEKGEYVVVMESGRTSYTAPRIRIPDVYVERR